MNRSKLLIRTIIVTIIFAVSTISFNQNIVAISATSFPKTKKFLQPKKALQYSNFKSTRMTSKLNKDNQVTIIEVVDKVFGRQPKKGGSRK